ncbi:hypothetical protein V2J09_004000 [Rumex salicifolius]
MKAQASYVDANSCRLLDIETCGQDPHMCGEDAGSAWYSQSAGMVRFSCFYPHIHGQKTKKQAQPPFETMVKGQLLSSEDFESLQRSPSLESSNSVSRNDVKRSHIRFSVGYGSNLGEMNTGVNNTRLSPMRQLRRSLSLGCNLQEEGRIFEDNNSDEHSCVGFSCDGSHDQHHVPTTKTQCPKSPATTTKDQDQEEYASVEPLNYSCTEVNNESIFSVGEQQYPEKEGGDDYYIQMDAEGAVHSGIHTPKCPFMISKSCSLPNLPSTLSRSGGYFPNTFLAYRNRSSEALNMLGMMGKKTCDHDASAHSPERNKDYYFFKSDQNDEQNGFTDGYEDSYNYAASNKDWIVPVVDGEMIGVQKFRGESSSHMHDQLPNEDFKIKWIESWVTDLHECGPVEEIDEIHSPHDQGNAIPVLKEEANLNPNMQAAKKYISSLSASATAAQLMNHGLVVIPFLSAFVSLKVVNLSGNSIGINLDAVKVTSGALPRGLHMLNLSKNKISTIEGLRELTRLRILDLSYNRITRIGHGLASCSSLKEVYLAGNKISEVEGLHRLLKLAVLDLRFNKISTSKGVGQLAANYNSLQAISLEGNPAQKNVGDEQLKKHLQGLLPHLAYYNRQSIKNGSGLLKDTSDRSVRLGNAAHQLDRAHKPVRRTPKGQAGDPPKRSRSKRGDAAPLPVGTRTTHHRHHHRAPLELNTMKPLIIPDFAMKKSQSMGALAAL